MVAARTRARRGELGAGKLGCLIPVLLAAGAVFVLRDVPGVYWRYYQMQDEVKSQASFAPGLTDQAIRERLVATADTLGIPLGPKAWEIQRAHGEIEISAAYEDSVVVDVLVWRRVYRLHFTPHASAGL